MDRAVDAQPLLDTLAALIIDRNPITENKQTPCLASFPPPHSGTLYYICGDLGLSAVYIGWAKWFAPYTHYAMWLRINQETQKAIAQVRFASVADAQTFCAQNEALFLLVKNDSELIIREK
jgi:hypothetical protein